MLLLLLVLFSSVALCVEYEPIDYGGMGSHYVRPALREMAVEGARCLPKGVDQQVRHWLRYCRSLELYRLLMSVALQRLIRELDSGLSLCSALPQSLDRMYSKMELLMRQRGVAGDLPQPGDGWAETAAVLTAAVERKEGEVERECRAALLGEREPERTSLLNCLKPVEKKTKKTVLVHHLP
jgi:hypothetical protein